MISFALRQCTVHVPARHESSIPRYRGSTVISYHSQHFTAPFVVPSIVPFVAPFIQPVGCSFHWTLSLHLSCAHVMCTFRLHLICTVPSFVPFTALPFLRLSFCLFVITHSICPLKGVDLSSHSINECLGPSSFTATTHMHRYLILTKIAVLFVFLRQNLCLM